MRLHTKVQRLALVGVAAAAIAAPVARAGVTPGTYVQIDGRLVAPQRLSAYEAQAGSPHGAHLVQFAGKLVPPSRLSETQLQASRTSSTHAASGGDSLEWSSTAVEVGVISSLVLVAATLGVVWRRGRLSTV